MFAPVPLTIAIPTFNRAGRLKSLLESICAQAGPDDELLVLDDGSKDGTERVVNEAPPFRLIRNEVNLGMVANWNSCLRAASRAWICLIHDDDTLMPGGLDHLRRACAIAAQPALIACQSVDLELDTVLRYRVCEPGAWAAWNCPTIPSGAVVHRQIVSDLGGFDPRFRYSADLEYFGRICTRYLSIVIQSPGAVRYNVHDTNYQFETWRQPDFYEQFLEIQQTILSHAGISGAQADQLVDERMTGTWLFMLRQARRLGDRSLARTIARRLWGRGRFGPRVRLSLAIAAIAG